MYRRILGICMALAALAVVLPATASASLTLEDTSGGTTVSLAVGSKIKAISEGVSTFTGGGVTVECNENFLTGEVVKNNGSKIEGTITAGEFASTLSTSGTLCKSGLGPTQVILPISANGTHWCIESVTNKDEFIFSGRGCSPEEGAGTLTFVFIFHTILGEVECSYARNATVNGSFTTETAGHEPATLAMANEPEFTKSAGSGTCPSTGKLKTLNFRLFTDLGTGVDDSASTAAPVWISDKA